MYNVFSIRDAERCGIHRERIRRAVGCCIEQLGRGVYVVKRRCDVTRHRQLRYAITNEVLVLPPSPGVVDTRDWWERELTEHIGMLSAITLLSDDVLSHHSAARLWGLPLLPKSPKQAEVSNPQRKRTGKLIRRRISDALVEHTVDDVEFHEAFGPKASDIVRPSDLGLQVTSLERTVVDICRDCALQEAVLVADAYIGGLLDPPAIPGKPAVRRDSGARRSKVFNSEGSLVDFPLAKNERLWRKEQLLDVAAAMKSAHGQRQFELVMAVCKGLSESPAESLANLGFFQLGLEVEQQFRIDDEDGLVGFADFRVKGSSLLFEVDGSGKYRDKNGSGLADMDVVDAEKTRTDRIHRRGFHTDRGGWAVVSHPERFGPAIWRALRAARDADTARIARAEASDSASIT